MRSSDQHNDSNVLTAPSQYLQGVTKHGNLVFWVQFEDINMLDQMKISSFINLNLNICSLNIFSIFFFLKRRYIFFYITCDLSLQNEFL